MRFFFVPFILIGWPLAEIAGFILVGKAVGLVATLGLVIATTLLGALMLRRQGLYLLQKVSAEGRKGRSPGRAIIDGAMVVVAGILLLLPGFITDIIGLLLLIPWMRRLVWRQIGRRFVIVRGARRNSYHYNGERPSRGGKATGPVVDLDADDFRRDPDPSSPRSSAANISSSRPSSPWAGQKGGES